MSATRPKATSTRSARQATLQTGCRDSAHAARGREDYDLIFHVYTLLPREVEKLAHAAFAPAREVASSEWFWFPEGPGKAIRFLETLVKAQADRARLEGFVVRRN